MQRRKVYVEVDVVHHPDGSARPRSITVAWGTKFTIDRVVQIRRAKSDCGGMGIRYTCMIGSTPAFLFDEENGKWFVEMKASVDA